jgi:aminoglycoside phosphotransferase (APT) family kinase protein
VPVTYQDESAPTGHHKSKIGAQWAPEHVVGPVEAAGLIAAQFPDLRAAKVEPLATGWDNTVHLVDGGWVFRFPRRAVAVPGVRREIAALPELAGRVPLPIPVPELVGRPADGYPWPFWGARLVPGRELPEAGLSDADRVPVAAGVGAFLRALHGTDPATVAHADLPTDPMARGVPAVRAAKAREALDRLAAQGIPLDPALDTLLSRAAESGSPPGPAVVVHGDLHVRHVLVDAGRATGVIDWGDLCLADPAVDLSLAYGAFAGPARAALLAAYGDGTGPVPPARELAARILAVSLCAALAEYAADEDRPVLLAESLAGLARAAGP